MKAEEQKIQSIGITFGCFIPMHTGHREMIHRSRCSHDLTIVAVSGYDGDRGDGFIPFRDRIILTKAIFSNEPDVKVVAVDDHKLGLTGTFSLSAWETWCKELFAQSGLKPDALVSYHWYSGEASYLEKICSIYPQHQYHLLNRSEHPISGTLIRKDWTSYRDNIHPVFLKYLEEKKNLSISQEKTMSEEYMTLVSAEKDEGLYKLEKDLYQYAGYYRMKYEEFQLIYVKTMGPGLGYKDCIFPEVIEISKKKVNMMSAIVFDLEEKTINTGNAVMDYELLQILARIASYLGFEKKNEDNVLIHRIRTAKPEDLTKHQIQMLMDKVKNT